VAVLDRVSGVEAPAASSTDETIASPDNGPDFSKFRVVVSMVERLTGRPVRVIDATDSAALSTGAPEADAMPTLSSQPTWGVTLGVMNRGNYGVTDGTAEVAARATVAKPDGTQHDLTVALHVSGEFAADQADRAKQGIPRPSDPLLLTFGGTFSALTGKSTTFSLELDTHSGVARVTVGTDTDADGADTAASIARRIAVAHRSFNDSRRDGTIVVVNKSIAMNKPGGDSSPSSRFQTEADAEGSSPAFDVSA
jgi:hypothetical protein